MELEHGEMITMAKIVMKYSKGQLIKMLSAVNLNELQNDMINNGCTKEELRHSSESFHDFETLHMSI